MGKDTSSKAYQATNQALLGPKCCSSFCVTLGSLFLRVVSHPIMYGTAEPGNEPVKFSGASGNMVFMLEEKPVWKQELSFQKETEALLLAFHAKMEIFTHRFLSNSQCKLLICPLTNCPLQHFF